MSPPLVLQPLDESLWKRSMVLRLGNLSIPRGSSKLDIVETVLYFNPVVQVLIKLSTLSCFLSNHDKKENLEEGGTLTKFCPIQKRGTKIALKCPFGDVVLGLK